MDLRAGQYLNSTHAYDMHVCCNDKYQHAGKGREAGALDTEASQVSHYEAGATNRDSPQGVEGGGERTIPTLGDR